MNWISILKKTLPLLFLVLLLFLSVFYSEELAEDSYNHFQTSVEVWENRDWKMLVTDTWNRPFPTVFYGILGQWGLIPARWVNVFFTLMTGLLTYKLAGLLLSAQIKEHPWTLVGFFICQLVVLPQSFMTMTELMAAFLLACGLFLYYKHRFFQAFFVLGFLPLARLETSLIMAWIFILFSLEQLQNQCWSKKRWLAVIQWNAVGSLPFLIWWGLGIYYTKSWRWFLESGISAYLRPWQFSDILKVNFFTGLPGVLSASALFLFLLGCCHLFTSFRAQPSQSRWFQGVLCGILVIHGFFLSSFVVDPKGSRFGDLAVGAINQRNFNVISPIIALFIFAGAVFLVDLVKQTHRSGWLKRVGIALILTEIALIGFYFFQQALGTGYQKGLFKLGLHHLILLVFCGWVGWNFYAQRRFPQKTKRIPFNLTTIACFLMISFVLSVPLFWHPLRFYDQQFLAQKELCSWLRTQNQSPRRIIQDVNSRLDRFCEMPALNAPWAWASTFQKTLRSSLPGSWVILETNGQHQPRSHYPADLLQSLKVRSSFALIKKSENIPTAPWELWLNRISSRNAPTRWVVYEKLAE